MKQHNQLLAQAKAHRRLAETHRKTADKLEAIAKKQLKLQQAIAALEPLSGRRTKAPANLVKFKIVRGKLSGRLTELLSAKTYSLDDLWAKVGPEKITPNYLSMCKAVYNLNKAGAVESVARGVWRATVKPTVAELHCKAK